MKKKLLFLFAVLTLRGSPQSGDIDTLYYLHDTTHFIPEYAIAGEVFNIHTRFYPQQTWEAYRILKIHLMFRPNKIGDTIQSISFYKDTLQQLIFSHSINKILDSNDVFPNWLKINIDNETSITGIIEVPTWWGELCEVEPPQISGNTIGFYDGSQAWGVFHYLPIKLIIERIPVRSETELKTELASNLEQNFPNPFNPSTRILYQVSSSSYVTLKVYDVLGNEIASLVAEYKPAGNYEAEFQSAVGNRQLASGVYYYQLKAGDYIQTKKMILIR
jgi:hypothetical protein